MAKEVLQHTRSLGGGGGEMFSAPSPAAAAADEELVESMAKRVVEYVKWPYTYTSRARVGGWSGIGRKRVMDRVAAIAAALLCDQKKSNKGGEEEDDRDFFFCGIVRVAFQPYIPVEYQIRKKVEHLLKMDLSGGGDIYWREICTALKWKPLLVIADNLKDEVDKRALGIPEFVTDTRGVERSFLKLVFTCSPYRDAWIHANGQFEHEFGELTDDVALRMILHEARSSAMSTVKEYLPDVTSRKFTSRKEEMTSMMLPGLALLHDNLFGMLTAECVIHCLLSSQLFFSAGCPMYYLRSEILSHPPCCFDINNNQQQLINSWEVKLLLEALSLDLDNRRLMFFYPVRGTFKILPDLYYKLAALASSSSSSSSSVGIMTQFQCYLVREESGSLQRVDMADWSQDVTRISFADHGQIKEVLLPPPSAAPANFPNISTLILQKNPQLEGIPDDVFRYMPNLRILDLSYCSSIGTLPSSLSSLLYLRMLYLQGCTELQTVETTGLDNLEVLDLDNCPLPTLHKASWCHMRSLKRFSFRNGLTSLGELQLSLKNVNVFDNFDDDLSLVPTAETLKKCNISILYPKEEEEEIRRRRTRDAQLRTSDDKFPYKDIHAAQVDHRRIIDTVEYPIVAAAGVDDPHEKCLEINGGEGLWSLYTLLLIFRPRLLSLHNYQHAQAGIWPIPELQTCYIKYCSDMEYAFNSPEKRKDRWNLTSLETLWISSLTKLSAICDNRFEQQNLSFLLLKSIYIEYCPNLLVLFPAAVRLPSLEVMEIKFCARLGKLFTQQYSTAAAGEIVLPRLERLRLLGLPELTSICDGEGGDRLPSLQKLEVRGCWKLKNVPIFPSTCSSSDDDVAADKVVVVVRGEEGWWKNVQGGGLKKKMDHIDFRMGFAAAAPKHIPQRWKKGRRRRGRHPLSL